MSSFDNLLYEGEIIINYNGYEPNTTIQLKNECYDGENILDCYLSASIGTYCLEINMVCLDDKNFPDENVEAIQIARLASVYNDTLDMKINVYDNSEVNFISGEGRKIFAYDKPDIFTLSFIDHKLTGINKIFIDMLYYVLEN